MVNTKNIEKIKALKDSYEKRKRNFRTFFKGFVFIKEKISNKPIKVLRKGRDVLRDQGRGLLFKNAEFH